MSPSHRGRRPPKDQKGKPRERRSGGDNTFDVTSLSALREYVRHRPAWVLDVSCGERNADEVRRILGDSGIKMHIGGTGDGVVKARVRHELGDFGALEEAEPPARDLIVALDHITDPGNLGAIVRSAAFFGVRHVLAPTRRQVLLTGAAVETCQGGFALTDLVPVVNLSRALRTLKDRGYWVLGADMGGEPVAALAGVYERVVLVLGNEEKGLAQGVRDTCDRIVGIPGSPDGLDSLNVSVAAGILVNRLAPELHP